MLRESCVANGWMKLADRASKYIFILLSCEYIFSSQAILSNAAAIISSRSPKNLVKPLNTNDL